MSDTRTEERFRILSLDGGGIYGLATARMLEDLCNDQSLGSQAFLKDGGDIRLFAGTSAGAINALMLAQEANPRELVTSGRLSEFWGKAGTYANDKNPMAAWLSLLGITAWLGEQDFLDLLQETFGQKKLSDLEHQVLIASFDWAGSRDGVWRPVFFTNADQQGLQPLAIIEGDPLIVDVAYAAASPPGFRALRNGFGDAGIFAPDPCLDAVAGVFRLKGGTGLDQIKALSIGVAAKETKYWLKQFDLSSNLFYSHLPTNPLEGNFYPPVIQILINAPTDNTVEQCAALLGTNHHRLDPGVLGPPELPPTLVATALARFPVWREYLVAEIEKHMNSSLVRGEIQKTIDYLNHHW